MAVNSTQNRQNVLSTLVGYCHTLAVNVAVSLRVTVNTTVSECDWDE